MSCVLATFPANNPWFPGLDTNRRKRRGAGVGVVANNGSGSYSTRIKKDNAGSQVDVSHFPTKWGVWGA